MSLTAQLKEPAKEAAGRVFGPHPTGRAARAVTFGIIYGVAAIAFFDMRTWVFVAGLVLGAALLVFWEEVMGHRTGGKLVPAVLFGIGVYAAVKAIWGPPDRLVIYGAGVGVLYGLMAAGIILIYRSHKVVNFAAGAMGSAAAVFPLIMVTAGFNPGFLGRDEPLFFLSWYLALPLTIICGAIAGGMTDFVFVRRFAEAPRLILTVVTIGLTLLFAFVAAMTPTWLGTRALPDQVHTPLSSFRFCTDTGGDGMLDSLYRACHGFLRADSFNGNLLLAFAGVAAIGIGLGAFLRYTRLGIAIRASAENANRAALLGIPVRRVGTAAWIIAGVLAALTVFLRAPLVGLPMGGLAGPTILLFALAAAVIARMESIPVAIGAAMAIGVIDQASVFATGRSSLAAAIMLLVILGALILQQGQLSRAYETGVSTWKMVKEFRPIPNELRDVREVRIAMGVVGAVVAGFFIALPFIVGEVHHGRVSRTLIFAIVAISLVVLTGWSGQISLGQFGLVGAGAAVAGGLAANHNVDFWITLAAGVGAGVLVSVLIGIPALRVQGLFLAVTTLAFAAAMQFYFLDRSYFIGRTLLPDDAARINRPMLWERFDLSNDLTFYYVCLAFLVLTMLCARAFRRNRSGRVLIAVRDNHRQASSYSLNMSRSRLAAFAISGAFAALAGVLLAYQQGAIDAGTYSATASLQIFAITVVGGITSIAGAVAGAVVLTGVQHAEAIWDWASGLSILATGIGMIFILMLLPGGFAEMMFRVRDRFLRWVARRNDIHVPSLVADERVAGEEIEEQEHEVFEEAQRHALSDEFDEVLERSVTCPVCSERIPVDEAPQHEHLRSQPAKTTRR